MKTTHTPGPWMVGGTLVSNGTETVARVLWRDNDRLTEVNDYDRQAPNDIGVTDANARLIAAAPKMLEALREIASNLQFWDSPLGGCLGEAYYIAKAAIAEVEWEEACLPPGDTFEIDDEYRFEVVATDESGAERIGEYDTLANAVAGFERLVEDNSYSDGRNPYTAFAIRPIGEVEG